MCFTLFKGQSKYNKTHLFKNILCLVILSLPKIIYVYPINVFLHNHVKLIFLFWSPVSNKMISVSFLYRYITRYKNLCSCRLNIAPAMDIAFLVRACGCAHEFRPITGLNYWTIRSQPIACFRCDNLKKERRARPVQEKVGSLWELSEMLSLWIFISGVANSRPSGVWHAH